MKFRLTITLLALAGLCTVTLSSCSSPTQIAEEKDHTVLKQGEALTLSGKNAEALSLFKKKLESDPKSADAHYGLGTVYAADFDYDKAIVEFNRAIELNPNMANAYNDRGNQYLGKDENDKAIADYNIAVKLEPTNYIHWYARSVGHLEQGNFKKALSDATEAVKRVPKFGPAYLLRAKIENKLNQTNEAAADIKTGLSLPATTVYEFKERGDYFYNNAQPELAFIEYSKIISLQPNNYEAYGKRGLCYQDCGNLAQALKEFNTAVKYAPDVDWYADQLLTLADLEYDAAHKVDSEALRWALACPALTTSINDEGSNSLLGLAPTASNKQSQLDYLKETWEVTSRQEFLHELKSLSTSGFKNREWKKYVIAATKDSVLPQDEYQSIDLVDGSFFKKKSIAKEYGSKPGRGGILAFDLCRCITLIRSALRAGFINQAEAQARIMPLAMILQKNYSSWEQMGEAYLAGRRFDSESDDWKEDEDDYILNFKLLLTQKNSPWVTIPWNTNLVSPIEPKSSQATSLEAIELTDGEIFDKLTSSDWQCPNDNKSIAGALDNGGTVTFNGDQCIYPASQTWLPGRKIESNITGVSTAGTVRLNAYQPSLVDQFFLKLDRFSKERETAQKFPFESPNGLTSLKWNFRKDDKRAGFIFLEDGSAARFALANDDSLYLAGHKYSAKEKAKSDSKAKSTTQAQIKINREQLPKIESVVFKRLTNNEWAKDPKWKAAPASTPPNQLKFDRDGHFNLIKDEQGNLIKGTPWSLINRDGMHIIFHANGPYYKCYPFDNESFEAKPIDALTGQNGKLADQSADLPLKISDWDRPELEPLLISDNELALILHLPTHTKYGATRYEHRFVASKTK